MTSFKELPPLSLYIHLPWCIRKCPYCDFNSHASDGREFPEKAYIEALIRDLDFALPALENRKFISIFLGGGTPSLFSAKAMAELLSAVYSRIETVAGIEITLEANPGTIESGRFAAFREAGINRLSLGIQSLDDTMLARLGRIHDSAGAVHAIGLAKSAGFERINLDLMYGLPGQTTAQALEDLGRAIAHDVQHLSWYQLTIEPNTLFYKHPPRLPQEDSIWDMQEQGQSLISAAGFENYEISAYAGPGEQCKHNLNYWQFGDYLGIGAGAHSKLTDIQSQRLTRYARHRLPERYMELAGGDAVLTDTRILTEADTLLEFMMNTLRLPAGFSYSLFQQRTGLKVDRVRDLLTMPLEKGWLEDYGSGIKPTAAGQNVLNEVLHYFMPDAESGHDYKHAGNA